MLTIIFKNITIPNDFVFVPLGCEKKKLTWKDVFSECFSCNVISCKINFVPKKATLEIATTMLNSMTLFIWIIVLCSVFANNSPSMKEKVFLLFFFVTRNVFINYKTC